MNETKERATVIVIGSGFGGTMSALSIARSFDAWNKAHPDKPPRTVLILERGTWWTTPVGTVQDPEVVTYDFLKKQNQPVQFWPSQNNFGGFIDIITRCFKRSLTRHGLYDVIRPGTTGIWSLLRPANDGVTVVRASGVGGGSLVYSNITIRPPELIFDDPRWAAAQWTGADRDRFYSLARTAISRGLLFALDRGAGITPPQAPVNTGLANIVTRSGGLAPHWVVQPDPLNPRGIKQIDPDRPVPAAGPSVPPEQQRDPANHQWLPRARVFQTAMKALTTEFGAVDLAINDFDPADPSNQYDAQGAAKNYCERQGRCNVGCLPGARHTLNKQLINAALGSPTAPKPTPIFPQLRISPLSTVNVVEALPGGGYAVHCEFENPGDYVAGKRRIRTTKKIVIADVVIVAAGCLGTNELMLRSRDRGTLPNLSPRVGAGFTTNGDYIAFLDKTKERVNLVRGPVTTSFGHFNTGDDPTQAGAHPRFHIIEDQGIPPAFASLLGAGLLLIRSLGKGRNRPVFLFLAIASWAVKKLWHVIRAPFVNRITRQDTFRSPEEAVANLMCIVAQGREDSIGQFRLGKGLGDTPLRVKRSDNRKFHEDPVYKDIESTLRKLSPLLRPPNSTEEFKNPFLEGVFRRQKIDSIPTSHPLGGCRIAAAAADGVVDKFGRVFKTGGPGNSTVYEGLFIADGSILPTALGVNPSLTITAVTLRIAENLIAVELPKLLGP